MSTQYIQQNTYKYSVQNINTLQINMWLACGQGIQFSRLMDQINLHNIKNNTIILTSYFDNEV